MKYTVQLLKDNTYQVFNDEMEVQFQGSLTDCDAWINLTEKGYL